MSDAELMLLVESKKKSGFLAAILNLFLPGVGYMYCGMWLIGLVVLALGLGALILGLAGAWEVYGVLSIVVFIDGFLAAGRYNKRMIAKVLRDREAARMHA